ncbi:hypothetical protein FPZ41_17355 [Streptomyces sp. K1PN6]|uniref:Uncharacterized protein n=1 Tax=Streptomyces acidicola TaxID=2596892 RepID=A0A5N8WSK8_9ACTN|nr:hypothetical protein [Streptomyces acidicola]
MPQSHGPVFRTHHDKCRARGRTHTRAPLRPARHRIGVLFAMLRDGTREMLGSRDGDFPRSATLERVPVTRARGHRESGGHVRARHPRLDDLVPADAA